ncbi:MAG: acyl-CoA dehydrogenase [Ramlibacter sp.]|nr:acyl-CoA dehydrogenase [Ramlibacter sp.]
MSFYESAEVAAVRQAARKFAAEVAPPEKAAEWDLANEVPRELLLQMASLGFSGLVVPTEYGGRGRHVMGFLAVIEELARRSFGLSTLYALNAGYGGLNLSVSGSEEQKRRFLPDILAGRLMFAYGLSEPDVGADLASVSTTVQRKGDQVVVRGRKRWTSGAQHADYIICLARSGPEGERHRNLSMVLVPTSAPGVQITNIRILGSGGNAPADVVFDDVTVPLADVMGGEAGWNEGWSQLVGPALEIEKIQPAAMALGIAEAAVEEAWTYSEQRRQFGRVISANQSIRHDLADARTMLHACRLMLQDAAWRVDHREASAVETCMTKLFLSEQCRDVVLSCQQVMGAPGYAAGHQMERLVRDSLCFPIIGGSSAIQRNNISNLLKLARG